MTNSKERLAQRLRDAHAMEEQAETIVSSLVSRLENYPELRDRFSLHLEETRGQAERVRECLERMGESTSMTKDAGAKMLAVAQGLSGFLSATKS